MTRPQWLLLGLIVIELVGGGYLLSRHLGSPTPPVPNLATVDPITATEIREQLASCRSPQQWQRLGEVYLATGFFPEAEACLRYAARLTPGSATDTFRHAFALERIGRIEEANAEYTRAIDQGHSRKADCWYYLGKNHLRLGDIPAATRAFQQAGNLAGARYELALLDTEAGRLTAARATAARLAEEFPDAYPPVSLLYRLALRGGETDEANRLADRFARRPKPLPTPFDREVDWIFGVANKVGRNRLFQEAGREAQAGHWANAETRLKAALDAGWTPEMADKLAGVLFMQGRRQEALDLLAGAVARGIPSPDLLWRWGQAQGELGQPLQALQTWERAARLATGPGSRDLFQDLADQYARGGNPMRAKEFAARAHLAQAIEAFDAGRTTESLQAALRATEANADLAAAWFYAGETERALGHTTEARAAYQRCLQLAPDHGRALRGLAILAIKPGQ